MKTCQRFLVSGLVQGVWFRGSTQDKALSLGLTGYACNMPDGRVEVLACGDDDKLDELQDWLWQGPPTAEVQNVENSDAKFREIAGFETG